jgi:hypothetical protein
VFVSDGLGTTTFRIPDEPVVMEQKGCQYKPHVLAMRAGPEAQGREQRRHHPQHSSPAEQQREWNVSQSQGVPVEEVFAQEEIAISVKCNIHPWMQSYIAVVTNPYYAVTDKNGGFELKDLPPGSYTLPDLGRHDRGSTQEVTEKIEGPVA